MITFSNPGEIDPRLISTMGCNVKESSNPIGFFGTGLKYALAVLAREQQDCQIWIGLECYQLHTQTENMRGKDFQVCYLRSMNGKLEALGFTTELGKQWSLENAYRELHCNTKDEGGTSTGDQIAPSAGYTTIIVSGEGFANAHRNRGQFLLEFSGKKKLFELEGLGEIYEGPGPQLFYKGIAVGAVEDDGITRYCFNLFQGVKLTENRTHERLWDTKGKLCRLIAACPDKEIIRNTLLNKTGPERFFYYQHVELGEIFLDTVGEMIPKYKKEMNHNAVIAYIEKRGKLKQIRRHLPLNNDEQAMLAAAIWFWRRLGHEISSFPINYVHGVECEDGGRVIALAEDGAIWLTPECFGDKRILRMALFEEYIHLSRGVKDETREMQNVLFSIIEELGGKIDDSK